MKKIYTLLVAAVTMATAASAQKVIDIKTTLIAPAAGTTITVGTAFPFQVSFKNQGTGAIAPTDTLVFSFTGASGSYILTGKTKAVGDTILLNTMLNFSAAPNGTFNFCAVGIEINRASAATAITDNDTSNNTNCNSIIITGGTTTGIANIVAGMDQRPEHLDVFPNPATNTVNLNYTARNSSEVLAHVFDITGKEVMVYSFGKTAIGKNDFKLDVATLHEGLYFIEVRQDGVRAVGKMNKQ